MNFGRHFPVSGLYAEHIQLFQHRNTFCVLSSVYEISALRIKKQFFQLIELSALFLCRAPPQLPQFLLLPDKIALQIIFCISGHFCIL